MKSSTRKDRPGWNNHWNCSFLWASDWHEHKGFAATR